MKLAVKILIVLIAYSSVVFLQEEKKIEESKAKLFQLRTEIAQLEEELSQKSQKEKESFATVENYNKQAYLLNKVINKLRKDVNAKQREINKLLKGIKNKGDEINALKENYSKYVIALYKKGPYNELESVFNAESFRQAVARVEYLKKFSERRKKDLAELKEKKKVLFAKKIRLEAEKKQKSLLVAEKESDEAQLQKKLNERKKILASIKRDKAALQKDIIAKKEAQKQIKNLIAKLVEEAERRREQLLASRDGNIVNETGANDFAGTEYSLDTREFTSFSALKGKMIWPLYKGKIIKGFGKNRNKVLNTITLNYGVDISSKGDMNVRCVADGIVSAIDWIPGYGSVIIVTHKGNYRTVYSHLAEIFVDEGDKVKTGSVIATVGESLEGKVLHFEIWSSRENQDPEKWLIKN